MEKQVSRTLLTHQKMLDNEDFILRRQNDEIAALKKKSEKEMKKHSKKASRKYKSCYYFGYFCVMCSLAIAPILLSECHVFLDYVISCLVILAGILLGFWIFKRIHFWEMQMMLPASEKSLSLLEDLEERRKEYFGAPKNTTRISFLVPTNSKDNRKTNQTIYKIEFFDAFVKDKTLCLWEDADLCGFPISAITSIVIVKQPLTYENNYLFPTPKESVAKEYNIQSKIVSDVLQHSTMPAYASMRIYHKEKHYKILFPIFELKQVLKLLNLKQQQKEKMISKTKQPIA